MRATESNIDLAIHACKGERSETLQNRQHMQMVKESLNEGYCDVSGHPTDMALVGEMGGIKIYVSKGVSPHIHRPCCHSLTCPRRR